MNESNQKLIQTLLGQIEERDNRIQFLTREKEIQIIRNKEKERKYKNAIYFLIAISIISNILSILYL